MRTPGAVDRARGSDTAPSIRAQATTAPRTDPDDADLLEAERLCHEAMGLKGAAREQLMVQARRLLCTRAATPSVNEKRLVMHEAGFTTAQIARRFGILPDSAKQSLRRARRARDHEGGYG